MCVCVCLGVGVRLLKLYLINKLFEDLSNEIVVAVPRKPYYKTS